MKLNAKPKVITIPKENIGKNIAIGGSITLTTKDKVLNIPKIKTEVITSGTFKNKNKLRRTSSTLEKQKNNKSDG